MRVQIFRSKGYLGSEDLEASQYMSLMGPLIHSQITIYNGSILKLHVSLKSSDFHSTFNLEFPEKFPYQAPFGNSPY